MEGTLTLEFLGYHWPWGGDLFYMTHPDGRRARVYVDNLGETWVDVRRVPEGGWFATERAAAWRAFNGSADAECELRQRGFNAKRNAQYAHRVHEKE